MEGLPFFLLNWNGLFKENVGPSAAAIFLVAIFRTSFQDYLITPYGSAN